MQAFENQSLALCLVPGAVYGTPVYITAEELRQIADFDFSSRPALAVQRDIFVFQCCVGCRIGDLYRMTWSNVEGDVFARHREIDKDIKRDALKVFEAYDLFGFIVRFVGNLNVIV